MRAPVDPDLVGIALAAPRSPEPLSPEGQAALDRRVSRPPCEPHCHADTLNPSSGGTFWCSACDRFTSDEIALAWIKCGAMHGLDLSCCDGSQYEPKGDQE